MKTKLILKSFSELPAPEFDSVDASSLEPCSSAVHDSATPGNSVTRGRWDPKEPTTGTLSAVLGRMAPAQFHVN
ncbi:MAG: hypothetical protein IPK15_04445 [Verrucomicrobia bacterium]|jgi:hypothetical protein|nr:hypothetical protein [Verrucomicrobiota bacterium]